MRELQPSDRELARRVIQSLFPDDDEDGHAVRRKFSASVSIALLRSSQESANANDAVAFGVVDRSS